MRTCPNNGNLYAVGGNNRDLRIWDTARKDPVFKAKNVCTTHCASLSADVSMLFCADVLQGSCFMQPHRLRPSSPRLWPWGLAPAAIHVYTLLLVSRFPMFT